MLIYIKDSISHALDSKDSMSAFFGGDIFATVITTVMVIDLNQHPLLKLIFIALGGITGGFFGVLGKRLFEFLEKKIK